MNDQVEESVSRRGKTILIIGINSFVGSNLAEFLKNDFRIVGTYHKRYQPIPGVLSLPCDVMNKDEIALVLYALKPDAILYCAGLSSLLECSRLPNTSDALNSAGLFNVAEVAPRYNARVIYFSSHYVFSGVNKSYNEMDNPEMVTQLGKSQSSSEFYLQKSSLNYLIIRCCKLYGRGISVLRNSWFEILQKNVEKNIPLNLDSYVEQGFLDVNYLGMILKMCLDKNITNRLINFSSQDVMSYYEFAQAYVEIFNRSSSSISKSKWHFPMIGGGQAPGEKLTYKLDVLNLEGMLKIKMPTIRESLELTLSRFHGAKTSGQASRNKSEGISYI